MIVYLAGAIKGCSDTECNSWRDEAIDVLNRNNIGTLNPMDRDYRGIEDENVNEIVELDKKDINNSDILLVSYIKPSVGTSMEVLYGYEKNKYIITFTIETKISPWLRYHSDKIYNSLTEGLNEILFRNTQTIMGK